MKNMRRLFLTGILSLLSLPTLVGMVAISGPDEIDSELSAYLPAQSENPDQALVNEAVDRYRAGEFDQAEEILTTLLIDYPQNSELYHYLGLIKFKQNQLVFAETYFSESLKLNPTDTLTRYNRGVVYFFLGDWKKAIGDCTILLESEPDNVSALNTRGLCHKNLGQVDEALADYEGVLRLEGENFMARFNRAVLLHGRGEFRKAIEDLNLLLSHATNEKRDALYYFRAECFERIGEKENAANDFTIVGRMNGPYGEKAMERLRILEPLLPSKE